MTEIPQRRQSIHPDDKLNIDKETNKELFPCEDCRSTFLVGKDETEVPLIEEEAEEYIILQKRKKGEVGTDLTASKQYKCKRCKLQAVVARHAGPERTISTYLIIAAVIIALVGGIYLQFGDSVQYYINRYKNIPVKIEKETKADKLLENQLFELEKLYVNQNEETWITLTAGIKSVIQETPNKPSMFLMLFDSDSAGNTAKCIAESVSKLAIDYLLRKVDTPKIIYGGELDKKWLLDDPGLLLKELKTPVQEKGALVVINLHEVPPKVAKMFHYVCDRYSPFVEKAVTFFTLKVDEMPSQENLQIKAQEKMSDLWKVLEDSDLRPLITRMTSNIIRIYPESGCYRT